MENNNHRLAEIIPFLNENKLHAIAVIGIDEFGNPSPMMLEQIDEHTLAKICELIIEAVKSHKTQHIITHIGDQPTNTELPN